MANNSNGNEPKKNCHAKHRERLRRSFRIGGLDSFSEHTILELVLFYSIPRKDTNELAHELIDRFGSLANVFDAPYEALLRVNGIGERTATFLKLIPAVYTQYMVCKNAPKQTITQRQEAIDYLAPYFTDTSAEFAVMLSLDGAGRVMNVVKMKHGTTQAAEIDINAVFSEVLSNCPSGVVLAHSHPKGLAAPSTADIRTTETISDMLYGFGVRLCDHIIFAPGEVFCMSLMRNRIRPGMFFFKD